MLNRNDNIKLPIGVIPVGSGNSFSSDLKMFDPIQAAKKISLLNTEHIDVLQLEMNHEMNFAINLVGWGLVKDVGARAEKLRLLGPIRYTFASIIEIFLSKGRKTELVVDGKKSIGMYTFIIGCNSIHVGNGMKMAPHAKLNDGLLYLVVVDGNISKFRLLSVMPQLFTGSHIKEKEVEYLQFKSFSIFSTEDEILNIDGELTGTTPIKVSVKEKEIEIFI